MSWKAYIRKQKLVTPSSAVPFKAMILAAGRGLRMRPLTDTLPKPLLQAGGKSLIEYQVESLARAGFTEIVINHAYLGELIEVALGNGKRYGVNLYYSHESLVLETAGGIAQVLPVLTNKLNNQPFLVVNADIYSEMDYASLLPALHQMQANPDLKSAHLVLVDNPMHHPEGDFALDTTNVTLTGEEKFTFSGIGIYHANLFTRVIPHKAVKLAPLLRQAIKQGKVGGEYFGGLWIDVGTPERLSFLDRLIRSK